MTLVVPENEGQQQTITAQQQTIVTQQQVIALLEAKHPNTKITEQEQQVNKKLIETSVASENQKAIEVTNYLKSGNITAAVNTLKVLDKERPSVKTKLWLATILNYTNPQEAKNYLKEAVELEPDNLDAINQYGLLLMRLGKVGVATQQFKQILQLTDDNGYKGIALGNLGIAYHRLSEFKKAIEYFKKALVIYLEISDRQGEGNSLGNLGSAYAGLSKFKKAIEYHEKDLAISLEIGDKQGEGSILGNLGITYADLGEVKKAKDYYQQAIVILHQIESPDAKMVEQNLKMLLDKE